MTGAEQFAQDVGDLIAIWIVVWLVITGITKLSERRRRRRHEADLLPPPCDGRSHNNESIAEWERKRARIDRSEITGRPS